MSKVIKINCSHASYVDKYYPSSNYCESSSLVTGIVSSRMLGFNLYKTILNFNVADIDPKKVKSAHLFIFVENMKYANTFPGNIGICGNSEDINLKSVVWNNFPKKNFTEVLYLNIPRNSSGSYIKIDILPIIQELLQAKSKYNLIFTPIDSDSSVIVKFSSASSNNPPYLKISLEESFSEKGSNVSSLKKPAPKTIPNSNKTVPSTNHNKQDINKKIDDGSKKEIIKNNNKSTHDDYLNNVQSQINFRNNQSHEIKTQTILNEILASLASQSQIISCIKNNSEEHLKDSPLKKELDNISNKIECYCEELKLIKDELLKKASCDDILCSDKKIEEVLTKLDCQTELIESIKNIADNTSTMKDIEVTNDHISALSENLDSLGIILNSLLESVSKNANSQDIDSINAIIATLINSLDNQNDDLLAIKDLIKNVSTCENIEDINNLISNLTDCINLQNEQITLINKKLESCASCDEVSANNALLIELNTAINAQDNNLASISDLITIIKSTIECQIPKINNVTETIDNLPSKEDIADALSPLTTKDDLIDAISSLSSKNDIADAINTLPSKEYISEIAENLSSKEDLIKATSSLLTQEYFTDVIGSLPAKTDAAFVTELVSNISQVITDQGSILTSILNKTDNDENFDSIINLLNNIIMSSSENSKTLLEVLALSTISDKNNTTVLNILNTIASESEINSSLIAEISNSVNKPDSNILELKEIVHELINNTSDHLLILKTIKENTDNSVTSDDANEININILNVNNELKTKLDSQYELLVSLKDYIEKSLDCAITPDNISSLESTINDSFQDINTKLTKSFNAQEASLADIISIINNNEDSEKIIELLNLINECLPDEKKIISSISSLNSNCNESLQQINSRLEKIESILYPLSINMNNLSGDICEIKDSITKINSKLENTKDISNENCNSTEMNSINDKLSCLNADIEKVMNMISSITIEPLD